MLSMLSDHVFIRAERLPIISLAFVCSDPIVHNIFFGTGDLLGVIGSSGIYTAQKNKGNT